MVDGFVYRSAEMSPQQLLKRVNKYDIKTVIDFRKTPADVALEEQALQKKGIQSINIPSEIVPDEKTVRHFLHVMSDSANYPILFHCEHGIGRSSLFEAIYRIEFLGWTNKEARQSAYWRSLMGSFKENDRRGQYLTNYKSHNVEVIAKFYPLNNRVEFRPEIKHGS